MKKSGLPPDPRSIADNPDLDLATKLQKIRSLQETLHLLPLESAELQEVLDLCHHVANQLAKESLRQELRAQKGS